MRDDGSGTQTILRELIQQQRQLESVHADDNLLEANRRAIAYWQRRRTAAAQHGSRITPGRSTSDHPRDCDPIQPLYSR